MIKNNTKITEKKQIQSWKTKGDHPNFGKIEEREEEKNEGVNKGLSECCPAFAGWITFLWQEFSPAIERVELYRDLFSGFLFLVYVQPPYCTF